MYKFLILALLGMFAIAGCEAINGEAQTDASISNTNHTTYATVEGAATATKTWAMTGANVTVFNKANYNYTNTNEWTLRWSSIKNGNTIIYYGGDQLQVNNIKDFATKDIGQYSQVRSPTMENKYLTLDNGTSVWVSWGQCTTMVKALGASGMPSTASWYRGKQVIGGNVPIGTAIATFNGNDIYSKSANHTGFFAGYGPSNSIMIWDQNWSYDGLMRFHRINAGYGATTSNSLAYYVILTP